MNHADVSAGVCECVAAVLDIPVQSVRLEDRIIDDLGAESLDLLDLVFRLEQKFGIAVSPRTIERRAAQSLGGKPLEVDGIYTPEAVEALRQALPEVPAEELHEGLTLAELPRTFRVATMANLVCRLMEEKGG